MKRSRLRPVWFLLVCLGVVVARPSQAEDVMGYTVEAVPYTYVVTSTVNVRAKPQAKSKRLGSLKSGATPDVIGRHKGWFAIAQDGEPFGFVYGSVMLPTLSGQLEKVLTGRVFPTDRSACDYVIRHDAFNEISGEVFGTSDYDLRLTCINSQEILRVHLPMFLVEGPLGNHQNPVFQISVDIPEIAGEYDRILSTIMLYRAEENVVRFDGFSLDGFGQTPDPREMMAANMEEALVAALNLAVTAWGPSVWSVLSDVSE